MSDLILYLDPYNYGTGELSELGRMGVIRQGVKQQKLTNPSKAAKKKFLMYYYWNLMPCN